MAEGSDAQGGAAQGGSWARQLPTQESFEAGAASRAFWTVESGDEGGLLSQAGAKPGAELEGAGCRQENKKDKIAA